MQRDQYLQFKADQEVFMARAELAKAFMSKLEQTKIEDANILAAINDWMETGDNSFFEEYCTFRFKKTADERNKELEDLKAEIEEAQKHKERLEEDLAELRSYDEAYREYFDKMEKWRVGMTEKIDEETPNQSGSPLSSILTFLEKHFEGSKHWKQKLLYVCIDGKLTAIKGVEVTEGGKILCSTTDEGVIMTEKPEAPYNISKRYYLSSNVIADRGSKWPR